MSRKAQGITFTYDQDQPVPADAQTTQPAPGADYRAEGPKTYSKTPSDDGGGVPPGNPGFISPDQDQMDPSSAKVIPDSMKETLREQQTYMQASASRVAARHRQARSKVAVRMSEILGGTSPKILGKAGTVELRPKMSRPKQGLWTFVASGSKGEEYTVRLKALRKGRTLDVQKLDLQVSCSCPFWQWQGPEHWGKTQGYLYGKPRGTAARPGVKDPSGANWVCKHVAAALELAKKYDLEPLPKGKRGSLEITVSPLPSPERVASRFAAQLPVPPKWYVYDSPQGDSLYVGLEPDKKKFVSRDGWPGPWRNERDLRRFLKSKSYQFVGVDDV